MMYNDARRSAEQHIALTLRKQDWRADMPTEAEPVVRTTVSIPTKHYSQLEELARQNRVSIAWIVRDAIDRYLTDRAPLLAIMER